jgi:uncharacterized protein (TIGR02246 family)
LILLGVGVAGQSQPQPRIPSDATKTSSLTRHKQLARTRLEKTLSGVCGQWAEYWRLKQLDKIVSLYAADAVFLTGTGDRISGRTAIRLIFEKAMAAHTSDLMPRSLVTEVSGNLAYDSGEYSETITAAGVAKTELKGNYLIVFKRQRNGKWLIIEHMWTDKPAS